MVGLKMDVLNWPCNKPVMDKMDFLILEGVGDLALDWLYYLLYWAVHVVCILLLLFFFITFVFNPLKCGQLLLFFPSI